MTLYYLVRHGEPDWSLKDRRQLSSQRRDFVPLTERGIKQAEGLLSKAANYRPVSSFFLHRTHDLSRLPR
ncbi:MULTISPECIES: histidine phosphatase family protein [unclassified Paenibacillus]|uniref:histidine phosphatase family protein n=1 Tax=unclassified Paenibacillus TaxID=185978 RepID=UPI0036457D0C